MKKRLVVLGLVGLMVSLPVLTACTGPAIPHSVEGQSNCISCHGSNGVEPYPAFHAKDGFDNAACTNCHKQAS